MAEIYISGATSTAELIGLLNENEFVCLRWQQYSLTATRNDHRPCEGSSTFSEFKWGRDKKLIRFLSSRRGPLQKPWLIRILNPSSAEYDWGWAGGETFVLQKTDSGDSLVNCYITEVAASGQ